MAGGFDAGEALRGGLIGRQQAWEFIGQLAAEWTAPLAPGDGVSRDTWRAAEQRIGAELPAALREAYLLFGSGVPGGEPALCCLGRGHSGAGPHRSPPVYVQDRDGGNWKPFLDRVSVACVEMVLSEVVIGRGQSGDMCELPGGLIAVAESAYEQMAVPEHRLWADPGITVRWFSAPGKLLRMDGRGPRCRLLAGGQTLADLEAIRAAVPGPWARARRTILHRSVRRSS